MTVYYGGNKIKDTGEYGVYLGSQNTNCLTYTPKNINLELSNGTLTLKKGSKVYVPNGFDAVRYYKYTYADWTQPVLTADGVLGGDSFAVYADPTNTDHPAYYAFDSSTSTYAVTHGADYIIYNNTPLNITKIDMTVRGSSFNYRGGTLYGSNDNSNWKEIIALSALTNGSWDISSNTGYYKYYKFSGSAGDWQPKTITLTATQQTGSVESTADDYDYTVGSGQMKFDEVVIANDVSHTASTYGSDIHFSCLSPNKNQIQSLIKGTQVFSGNTAPTVSHTYAFWYDTANNFVKCTIDGGATWESGWSLPFAIDSIVNGTGYTSIDKIFDWCGYIGSTAFVLPGVKGLIPNGFNADGTYKSIEFETDRVVTFTDSLVNRPAKLWIDDKTLYVWGSDNNNVRYLDTRPSVAPNTWCRAYIKNENKWLLATDTTTWIEESKICEAGEIFMDSNSKITSLTPYTAQPLTTVIPVKEIYNGSQLVYLYKQLGEVLFEQSTAGTYTFTAPYNATVDVVLVGGGGGGSNSWAGYRKTGGSAGMVTGSIAITRGTTYTIVVGGGGAYGYGSAVDKPGQGATGGTTSAFGNNAYGGAGGYTHAGYGSVNAYDGAGGSFSVVSGFTGSNGVAGSTANRYGNYGGGGFGSANGAGGYVKITVKG